MARIFVAGPNADYETSDLREADEFHSPEAADKMMRAGLIIGRVWVYQRNRNNRWIVIFKDRNRPTFFCDPR